MRIKKSARVSLVACAVLVAAGCAGDASDADKLARVTALERRIAELAAEATRLDDVSQIKRLQRMYGFYFDNAQWDQVADLFVENGTIEIGLDGVYAGRERVREYLYALGGGKAGLRHGQLNEHMQVQPFVTVAPDGRTAKARWRAIILKGEFGKGAWWGEGPYENEYVKEDGVWKFSKVHWYQTYMVPYEGGWAKNRDVNGGIYVSGELPPDRPPSERYDVWPGVYIPPMHYDNPATSPPERPARTALGSERDPDPTVAQLQDTVAALERRIERLEDVAAIEKLVSAYGYYLDKQMWDEFANLFADDATMEISKRGVYVGRARIREALHLFGPQFIESGHLHNHIQLQPLITVAPDGHTAWVRSRVFSQLATYEGVGVLSGQIYENELVKEDGVWKFKRDHSFTTYFGDYERGWAQGARPSPRVSEKIPPDRPPTHRYDSFPGVYVPPFHYPHPVTGAPIVTPELAP